MKEISGNSKSVASFAIALLTLVGAISVNLSRVSLDDASADECTDATCNTTFEVNVQDSLTVSITPVEDNATGNAGTFLRDQINLDVSSNVSNGFTASMYSSADNASSTKTDLSHTTLGSSYVIPTLSSSAQRSSNDFTDHWGYSLQSATLDGKTYGETDAGNNSSTYHPLTDSTSTPIKLITAGAGTKTGSQHIYFGTKASSSKPAGTYANTVVISVVTGTINNDNPITPTNPVNPTTDIPNNGTATYTGSTGTGATQGVGTSGSTGTTVYTTTSTSAGITTTTTQVSGGDVTSSYTSPQGVRSTEYNAASGVTQGDSALPIGLAVTAGLAATAGTVFFILAKKDDDDDDEEEEV